MRARHARLSSAQYAVRGVLHASTDKRRVGLVCAPRRGRASRRRGVGSAQWANSLPSVERRKSERRTLLRLRREILIDTIRAPRIARRMRIAVRSSTRQPASARADNPTDTAGPAPGARVDARPSASRLRVRQANSGQS